MEIHERVLRWNLPIIVVVVGEQEEFAREVSPGRNGNGLGSDNGSMKGLRTYRDRVVAVVESAIYGVILSGMKGVWGPPN